MVRGNGGRENGRRERSGNCWTDGWKKSIRNNDNDEMLEEWLKESKESMEEGKMNDVGKGDWLVGKQKSLRIEEMDGCMARRMVSGKERE